MKKRMIALLVLFSLFLPNLVFAGSRSEVGPKKRPFAVMGRGVLNILGFPAEFVSTAKREKQIHPKAWPVSFIPRSFSNIFIRLASGVNDVIVLPWAAPFTEDVRPLTDHLELPTYPWQSEI